MESEELHLIVEGSDAGDFGGNKREQLLHHAVDFAPRRVGEFGERFLRLRERSLVGIAHNDENQKLVGSLGVAEQERSPESEMLAHVVRLVRLRDDEGFHALDDLLHQRRDDDDVAEGEEGRASILDGADDHVAVDEAAHAESDARRAVSIFSDGEGAFIAVAFDFRVRQNGQHGADLSFVLVRLLVVLAVRSFFCGLFG